MPSRKRGIQAAKEEFEKYAACGIGALHMNRNIEEPEADPTSKSVGICSGLQKRGFHRRVVRPHCRRTMLVPKVNGFGCLFGGAAGGPCCGLSGRHEAFTFLKMGFGPWTVEGSQEKQTRGVATVGSAGRG